MEIKMEHMRNTNLVLLIAIVAAGSCLSVRALEPLTESNEDYQKVVIDRFLVKSDKNGNGIFEKEEDETQWKRNRKLDQNNDGALGRKELEGLSLQYVTSPGKQLRNVRF